MAIVVNNGERVTFSLYSGLAGQIKFNGEVVGKVESEMAVSYPGNNVLDNHINIWPMLPEEIRLSINNSHTSYQYICLKTDDGEIVFIGVPWIRENTWASENPRKCELTISNFTDEDGQKLTKILTQYDYTIQTLKIS